MRVDPSNYQQVLGEAEIQHLGLVDCLTRVWRTLLLWDQETRDEQRIVNGCSTKDPTHLQASSRVRRSNLQE